MLDKENSRKLNDVVDLFLKTSKMFHFKMKLKDEESHADALDEFIKDLIKRSFEYMDEEKGPAVPTAVFFKKLGDTWKGTVVTGLLMDTVFEKNVMANFIKNMARKMEFDAVALLMDTHRWTIDTEKSNAFDGDFEKAWAENDEFEWRKQFATVVDAITVIVETRKTATMYSKKYKVDEGNVVCESWPIEKSVMDVSFNRGRFSGFLTEKPVSN